MGAEFGIEFEPRREADMKAGLIEHDKIRLDEMPSHLIDAGMAEMGQRILALEEEKHRLQQLVCYLMTKNETLRCLLCEQ